jgi:O-antigen ligase
MYIFVPNIEFLRSFLFFLEEESKTLTSRVEIWEEVISDFKSCFLLGDYNKYFDEQMHNSLATLFTMYGLPFLVSACLYMYYACKKIQEKSGAIAMLSVCAILFTGCFEASVFVGIAGFYLIILIAPAIVSKGNIAEVL